MSTTIAAAIVNILSVLLPLMGIQVGTEALTTTISTILALGSGLYIWYHRYSKGDVGAFGNRR